MIVNTKAAFRPLRHRLAMSVLVLLTLGLGVGANTALLILADDVLYRLPGFVRQPEELVSVSVATNYVTYQQLREETRTLDAAAYVQREIVLGSGPDATLVNVECISHPYFRVLGVQPSMGRDFNEEEDVQRGAAVVVLSDGLWRRLGSDADALDLTLEIGGRDHSVIGVMPAGFTGAKWLPIDAWILLSGSPEACSFTGDSMLDSRKGSWLSTVGRIRPGFTIQSAAAEVESLALDGEILGADASPQPSSGVSPLYDSGAMTRSRQARIAWWLALGGGAIFLVACLNVAGVLSAEMIERRRELAIQVHLGATRRRILAELSSQTLVLAALSSIVAVFVATGVRAYVAEFFPLRPADTVLGVRALGVIAWLALIGGVLGGAVPVLQGTLSTSAADALRGGYAQGPDASKLRSALLVGQVGLSFVLLICAGLFVRSVENLVEDPGYDWDRIVVATVDQQTLSSTGQDVRALFERLIARVVEVPEVEFASVGPALLASGGPGIVGGVSREPGNWGVAARVSPVSPDYFRTLGTHIVEGRSLALAPSGDEVVLDADLARELWPRETAVGKCVFMSGFGDSNCIEVVGVSQARRYGSITGKGESEVFVALERAASPAVAGGVLSMAATTLLVRTRGTPDAAVKSIAAAIYDAVPEIPFVQVRPLAELVSEETRSWRLGANLFGLLGGLAVLIGGVGIYGSLARWVRSRIAETGVRMALGATARETVSEVLRRGLTLVTFGIAVGGGVAIATTRYLESLLFEISSNDPMVFAVAALVVLATGVMGCLIPALRASAVDPAVALRGE